jgi:hypothetical protein
MYLFHSYCWYFCGALLSFAWLIQQELYPIVPSTIKWPYLSFYQADWPHLFSILYLHPSVLVRLWYELVSCCIFLWLIVVLNCKLIDCSNEINLLMVLYYQHSVCCCK